MYMYETKCKQCQLSNIKLNKYRTEQLRSIKFSYSWIIENLYAFLMLYKPFNNDFLSPPLIGTLFIFFKSSPCLNSKFK